MKYTQNVVYELQLPTPVTALKNACLDFLIPTLENTIQHLQSQQVNNSYVSILSVILFLLVFRAILPTWGRSKPKYQNTQTNSQMAKQLTQFRTQLKSVKNTVKQLRAQLSQAANSPQKNEEGEMNLQPVRKLMESYKQSMEENEKIAQYIIDSQQEILKQLKLIKKMKAFSDRSPSNASFEENIFQIQKSRPEIDQKECEQPLNSTTQKSENEEKKTPPEIKRIPPPNKPLTKKNVPPPPVRK